VAVVTLGVAAAVFWIAYDDASYGVDRRNVLAVAVWWSILLLVALGIVPIRRLRGPTLIVAGLLLALALLTLASLAWSPSAEKTLHEVNRVTLYLGVVVLVSLVVPRGGARSWTDGLTLAIAAVAVVALASRCFPDLFGDRGLAELLPSSATRLSFPLGYWNGLAIFLALGVPLLLGVAVAARSQLARAAALLPFPVLGAALYLTSSRGGVATALVGSIVFFALTARRWEAGLAITVGAAGAMAAVVVLLGRDELVDGPLGSSTVEDQGRGAALLIAGLAVATGLAFAAGSALLRRVRPSRTVGLTLVATAVLLLLAVVVYSDPPARFREFRTPLDQQRAFSSSDSFVRAHLLSGGGSGRWQFWESSVDQWRAEPLLGGGAGTYEAWWAANAPFSHFVRDAHSLYLEQLGELGPLGLVLVLAIVGSGLAVGTSRVRRLRGPERVTAAALTAVVAGFALAAGIDWMWELTAVTVVGLVAIALLTGSGTEPGPEPAPDATRMSTWRALSIGVTLLAVVAMALQAVPLFADYQLARSRDAAARGDGDAALEAAATARDLEPWAATPRLQQALVEERLGRLRQARSSVGQAIERDGEDWRLWLVAARLDTKLGQIEQASRALARAAALNPRSPLFRSISVEGA
jgi:tetratricopeptide (TPR) repeat protein